MTKLCEQCNTHKAVELGNICARCALRKLAELAQLQDRPESAKVLLCLCHDSVPQEWVEGAFEHLMNDVWKPTPLIVGGEVVNQGAQ